MMNQTKLESVFPTRARWESVLELAHIMAVVCGLMLADLGADVIKVEKMPVEMTPEDDSPKVGEESAAFMMMNRNKRGIAVNSSRNRARKS